MENNGSKPTKVPVAPVAPKSESNHESDNKSALVSTINTQSKPHAAAAPLAVAVAPAPVPASTTSDVSKTPKKRRKVNHACVYCRRSHMTCDLERPCTRCIKRNIGHLCHDEPRDPDSKKSRSVQGSSVMAESDAGSEAPRSTIEQATAALRAFETGSTYARSAAAAAAAVPTPEAARAAPPAPRTAAGLTGGRGNSLQQLVQPTPTTGIQAGALNSNLSQFSGFNDAWLNNPFHDMHNYHPNYMIPEVSHEFNLLNEFLHSSLLDDNAVSPAATNQLLKPSTGASASASTGNNTDSKQPTGMGSGPGYFGLAGPSANSDHHSGMPPPSLIPGQQQSTAGLMGPPSQDQPASIPHPSSIVPQPEKAREYYLQAADPDASGGEGPEDRMQRLLTAKYEAGLLKPFNYTKGYSQLLKYLDGHVAPSSKQKILRQLDRFRPKFREQVEGLTDMDLVIVEIWFERTLMEYDRVFASMAVPACCWRRTGELFRGNTEMAELLGIPVDNLRDGKISLHEILTEESLVRYWEEFGTIAVDPDHDSLLTACALKSPDESIRTVTNCCFSFMIRRDPSTHLPGLIVGNFLPHDP